MSSGSQSASDAVILKFDMHVNPPVLSSDEVNSLVAEYDIPSDLHPCVPPSGLTMNRLPADKIDRRAIPDTMPWRHQDSSLADPAPTGVHAEDISRLCENVIDLRPIHPAMLYTVGLTTICVDTKSNLLFDAQKIQKNPIFQISVDILRNTNFFRAFSASASIPAIYIQQFWNTMKYDEKTGVYCCQVDEQWFNLSAYILRKALDITPVDPAHPFKLPPTGDTVIDFVNQLGYPEPCLTGKTSGKFTQGIQTFFSHKVSHKASLKDPKKKAVPILIPYGRFTKMIIYYVGSTSNVHRRPESPRHLLGDDFLLGNLKFIPKGETYEVFEMAISKPLITKSIQQSSYYLKYLEMVAKNTKKTPQDSASKKSVHGTKHAPPKKLTPVKPTKLAPVKQTKPPSSKLPKSPKNKPSKITPSRKVRKGKPSLVDEEDEAQQEPEPQREGDDPALELAKKLSLDAHQEKGEGEGADADLERAIKLDLDPSLSTATQGPGRVGVSYP
ncbi:hypothetical protein Tco_0748908 [Tanacetum coccineum]|uniref:Histone deacetylase 14 n=1 Tax=Tanacetum coccineum TaxID=301880 RepID=A0ABQ4YXQ7_9ASTR